MNPLYILSVWLHIIAAAVFVGGMVFLTVVLVPLLRRPEYKDVAASLFHRTGVRLRWVGWATLALLVLSGFLSLVFRVGLPEIARLEFWLSPFGEALGIKVLLVAIILILAALHDFVIGPKATALWMANPTSREAMKMRRISGWIGRANLILTLIVIALAVVLVRGWF